VPFGRTALLIHRGVSSPVEEFAVHLHPYSVFCPGSLPLSSYSSLSSPALAFSFSFWKKQSQRIRGEIEMRILESLPRQTLFELNACENHVYLASNYHLTEFSGVLEHGA
jgi:hypothetical protein